jgi:indole-3-glycerol phosphate synthase
MRPLTHTVLDEIVAARRIRLEQAKRLAPFSTLQDAARSRMPARDFAGALSKPGLQVIAELKKASPSCGVLREDYHVQDLAAAYQSAGAAAISVLTEPDFFRGSLEDLKAVRETVRVPCLRKDFIIDAYQVFESAAVGADALLLIVTALTDENLKEFTRLAGSLGMAALVEVHTEEELDRALTAGSKVIGVNNRDLHTLEVKIETSLRLRKLIPAECLAVSESGIHSLEDLKCLEDAGYDAILIGEHFMLSHDPGRELARFQGELSGRGSVRTTPIHSV